jgi:ABC-type polysaccharide/polyol phosphate export permease
MVATLGVLYGGLFNQPMDAYLPHMATGFMVCGFFGASSWMVRGPLSRPRA